MPAFSEDQINEAKERVRRMHARAGSYLPREEPPQGHNDRQTAPPPGKEKHPRLRQTRRNRHRRTKGMTTP